MFQFLLILLATGICQVNPFAGGDNYSSGYVSINRSDQSLFYWLQFARNKAPKTPLILWLQGGPGCASMNDQFTDIGSFNIYPNGTIYNNTYAWNTFANLLFVDQPLCTGLSYCTSINLSPNNEEDISRDLYVMLKNVMNMFPQLKGMPVYVSGHSYGGHYVPSVARYFILKNDPDVVVEGISIGDGWFNTIVQSPDYSRFSKQKNLCTNFEYTSSLMSFTISNLYTAFNFLFPVTKNYFIMGNIVLTGINPKFCVYELSDAQCPDDGKSDQVTNLLNNATGKTYLNITKNGTYEVCSGPVYNNMQRDYMNTTVPALEFILSKRLKTIIYVGRKDWICNELGNDDILKGLKWEFNNNFNNAQFVNYYVNGELKGIQKSWAYLTYIKLTNCGHGSEQDDPVAAYDIMERMLN